jgi:hypothetical protein
MIWPFKLWFVWKSQFDDLQGAYDLAMQENNRLRDLINNTQPKPIECKSYGTISNSDVYIKLRNLFPDCDINLSDSKFQLADVADAKIFTKDTQVAYGKWTTENHDCDNFSFAAMGYWSEGLYSFAYGIAWSQTHAFNIFIDRNKQIWIVEPQNNVYTKIEDMQSNETYYPIRLVVM